MTNYQQTSSLAAGARFTEQAIQAMEQAAKNLAELDVLEIKSSTVFAQGMQEAITSSAEDQAYQMDAQAAGQFLSSAASFGGSFAMGKVGDNSAALDNEAEFNENCADAIAAGKPSEVTAQVHITEADAALPTDTVNENPAAAPPQETPARTVANDTTETSKLNDAQEARRETLLENKSVEKQSIQDHRAALERESSTMDESTRSQWENKFRSRAKTLRNEASRRSAAAQTAVQSRNQLAQGAGQLGTGISSVVGAKFTVDKGAEDAANQLLSLAEKSREQTEQSTAKQKEDTINALNQLVASQTRLYSAGRG